MFKKFASKKFVALALCGALSLGLVGTTTASVEASPHHHHHDYRPAPPAPKDTHSQGEVNTAAIVGAVVGYVIGQNT